MGRRPVVAPHTLNVVRHQRIADAVVHHELIESYQSLLREEYRSNEPLSLGTLLEHGLTVVEVEVRYGLTGLGTYKYRSHGYDEGGAVHSDRVVPVMQQCLRNALQARYERRQAYKLRHDGKLVRKGRSTLWLPYPANVGHDLEVVSHVPREEADLEVDALVG